MGDAIDAWAADWLKSRRESGKTGISVEKRNGVHQLRWQTTEWDAARGKRVKKGNYIGRLEFPGRVVLAKGLDAASLDERARRAFDLTVPAGGPPVLCDQRVSGPMRVIDAVCGGTLGKLRGAFPSPLADDLWMLAAARLFGMGRLVRAGRWFGTVDNVSGLCCRTDPEALSESLRTAGMSSLCQKTFFDSLAVPGMKLAGDMTVVFSGSRGAFLVKKGYNRFRLSCGQYNLVVICALEGFIPICMKTVAGNVGEGSIKGMLREFDIGDDVVVVLDRGYDMEDLRDAFDDSGRYFIIPVDRGSTLYSTVPTGDGTFTYRNDVVRFGHGDGFGYTAYRYENIRQRNEEVRSLTEDAGGILLGPLPEETGNLILVTNLNESARDVYRMYKCRSSVENGFDTGKTLLSMDSSYMHDSFHIMGFNFVTFLALRIRSEIESLMTATGLDSGMTVEDVLFAYSNATVSRTSDGQIMEYVPADLRRIDSELGLNIYLKNRELE